MKMLLPIVIEIVGVALISTGIGVELATHAEIGYMLITLGSVVIATGGMVWAKFMRR